MRIPVFLSYPKPHLRVQKKFVSKLETHLRSRGLEPRTLGITDYDMDVPLRAIRRLMMESNGIITVAFRRTLIVNGRTRPKSDLPKAVETPIKDVWLTSPYCQIEPAMAYQLGLPVLILREQGVAAEGLLERGIVGLYMPEFTLAEPTSDYLDSMEWKDLMGKWEGRVRSVVEKKGRPPKLF